MLRADADADDPRRDAPQNRKPVEQPHDPGRDDRLVGIQQRVDDPALHCELHALNDLHRQGAAALHRSEFAGSQPALAQRYRENIGGGDRVLHRQIDPDPADRRHRVRRVADAQQPGPPPSRQPVDATVSNLMSSQSFSSCTRSAR
jgi:hypothetical protein